MAISRDDKRASIFIALATAIRLLAAFLLGFRPFDDSYITFRYALNLATGHGFVYNWGERVLGTTTPLWTMVLAAGVLLHLPLGPFAVCVSLVLDAGTAYLLFRILARLGYMPVVGTATSVLFLLLIDYFALGLSGMETSLFVFLLVATLFSCAIENWVLTGILGGVATLTRPDGVLVGAAIVGTILATKSRSKIIDPFVSVALGATLVVVPWLVFAKLYFGSPTPQSIVAKAHWAQLAGMRTFSNRNLWQFAIHGQYGGGLLTRTYLQGQILLTLAAALGVVAIVKDAICASRSGLISASVLFAFPITYAVVLGSAAAFTWYPWYYGPFYPFLAALAPIGVARVGVALRLRSEPLLAGLVGVLFACQIVSLLIVKLPAAQKDFWTRDWAEIATNLPRDRKVTVAADEIGMLGWGAYPVTVYDLIGLVSPQALAYGSQSEYLRSVHPDYIALRTADAAALLTNLRKSDWFSSGYCIIVDEDNGGFVLYKVCSHGFGSVER